MSTWNAVTIESDHTYTDAELDALEGPEEWGLWEADGWTIPHPYTSSPAAYGWSKWHRDEIGDWAKQYTAEHPGVTVRWREEWDDEEAGQRETVYRNGAVVREECKHSELVPDILPSLISDARQALKFDALTPAAVDTLTDALTALVDALDPNGAA